jgi:hypothetical protein
MCYDGDEDSNAMSHDLGVRINYVTNGMNHVRCCSYDLILLLILFGSC